MDANSILTETRSILNDGEVTKRYSDDMLLDFIDEAQIEVFNEIAADNAVQIVTLTPNKSVIKPFSKDYIFPLPFPINFSQAEENTTQLTAQEVLTSVRYTINDQEATTYTDEELLRLVIEAQKTIFDELSLENSFYFEFLEEKKNFYVARNLFPLPFPLQFSL